MSIGVSWATGSWLDGAWVDDSWGGVPSTVVPLSSVDGVVLHALSASEFVEHCEGVFGSVFLVEQRPTSVVGLVGHAMSVDGSVEHATGVSGVVLMESL